MFTGIVEEVGRVIANQELDASAAQLRISGPLVTSDAALGDSICVSGVCLTIMDLANEHFSADVMAQTLAASMLADLEAGSAVNLERSATPTTRLGGHIVTGHVDAVGVIADVAKTEHWTTLRIAVPADIATQIAKKGSVAVDGVSLTVGAVGQSAGEDYFEVSLIPTTLAKTTLGSAVVGRRVNIETDVVAKYVQRILDGGQR